MTPRSLLYPPHPLINTESYLYSCIFSITFKNLFTRKISGKESPLEKTVQPEVYQAEKTLFWRCAPIKKSKWLVGWLVDSRQ